MAPKMIFVPSAWSVQMDFSATERINRELPMSHRRKGGKKNHQGRWEDLVPINRPILKISFHSQGRKKQREKRKTSKPNNWQFSLRPSIIDCAKAAQHQDAVLLRITSFSNQIHFFSY